MASERMKMSLVTREMQIKTTIKYYFIFIRIGIVEKQKQKEKIRSVREDVEKF